MRRAAVETGGFSQISSVTARSPNESRGSLTDVDSVAKIGSQGHSQKPIYASATASTPAQSAQSAPPHDTAMVDIYRMTQAMLRDFLKEKNEARSECQPFFYFVAAEAEKLPSHRLSSFRMRYSTYYRGPGGQIHRGQIQPLKHPPRIISD